MLDDEDDSDNDEEVRGSSKGDHPRQKLSSKEQYLMKKRYLQLKDIWLLNPLIAFTEDYRLGLELGLGLRLGFGLGLELD
jgi:hypothetical protein